MIQDSEALVGHPDGVCVGEAQSEPDTLGPILANGVDLAAHVLRRCFHTEQVGAYTFQYVTLHAAESTCNSGLE